jgi:hypothetical protein
MAAKMFTFESTLNFLTFTACDALLKQLKTQEFQAATGADVVISPSMDEVSEDFSIASAVIGLTQNKLVKNASTAITLPIIIFFRDFTTPVYTTLIIVTIR